LDDEYWKISKEKFRSETFIRLKSIEKNKCWKIIVDSKGNSSNYQSYSYSDSFDTCRKEIQRRLLACAEHFKYLKPAVLGGTTVACKGNLFIDILRHHVVVE
jgi:hypothetical protein